MTKREAERLTHQENVLLELGFTRDEAEALRRISRTLHRWYELECGDSNAYGSFHIERDEQGIPYRVFLSYGPAHNAGSRLRIPDRERGAERRLAKIIYARNQRDLNLRATNPQGCITAYLQTDPRGASLYIIRPGDVPEGKNVESYYIRGVCVY